MSRSKNQRKNKKKEKRYCTCWFCVPENTNKRIEADISKREIEDIRKGKD